jgi:hypothetical protein
MFLMILEKVEVQFQILTKSGSTTLSKFKIHPPSCHVDSTPLYAAVMDTASPLVSCSMADRIPLVPCSMADRMTIMREVLLSPAKGISCRVWLNLLILTYGEQKKIFFTDSRNGAGSNKNRNQAKFVENLHKNLDK